VTGAGYLAVWRGLFADSAVDGLMVFTQKFAIPCLLFRRGDAGPWGGVRFRPAAAFYYTGSAANFFLGMFGARLPLRAALARLRGHRLRAAFCQQRASGPADHRTCLRADALAANFAIVSVHAAFCYLLGITAMEIVKSTRRERAGDRAKGRHGRCSSNALMIGIALGFVVNLSGLTGARGPAGGAGPDDPRRPARGAVRAGRHPLPLQARGRSEHRGLHLRACTFRTSRHDLALGSGPLAGLSEAQLRSAVVTAAMAPGVNSYLFADMYGVARRVAATAVLAGTALSVITA
jgi:malonate transporter